jgi:ribonuclease BN (tRNA processing enzyme)
MKDYFHIENYNYHVLEPQKMGEIGQFKVKAIEVVHDTYCFAYLIHHPESGLILFITDSFYSPHTFQGLNQIILECNYDEDILNDNIEKGKLPLVVRNRVRSSHMSLGTVKTLLEANDLSQVQNIVLTHLSDGNSNAGKFREEITKLTGKKVFIADKNMNIDFNKEPF